MEVVGVACGPLPFCFQSSLYPFNRAVHMVRDCSNEVVRRLTKLAYPGGHALELEIPTCTVGC